MTDDTQDEGPVFRDKRRIDPETGEARQSPADAQAAAERAAADGAEAQGSTDEATDAGAQAPASAPGPDDLSAEDRALLDGEAQRLAEEAASVEARIAAAEDEVRRLQAEYVNYRNRVERERAADKVSTTASVLSALLPSLDDLDRADQHGDLEGSPLAIVAHGRWAIFPAMVGVCAALFLGGLGLSSVSSVVAPYAVSRPGDSPFQQPQRTGSGGVIAQGLVMLGAVLTALPAGWLTWQAIDGTAIDAMFALWVGAGAGALVLILGIVVGAVVYERRATRLMEFAEAT